MVSATHFVDDTCHRRRRLSIYVSAFWPSFQLRVRRGWARCGRKQNVGFRPPGEISGDAVLPPEVWLDRADQIDCCSTDASADARNPLARDATIAKALTRPATRRPAGITQSSMRTAPAKRRQRTPRGRRRPFSGCSGAAWDRLETRPTPRYAASSGAEPLRDEQVTKKLEAPLPRRKGLYSPREHFRIFKIVVGVVVPVAAIDFARRVALFLS